ncbi:TlpA family protein disulfide reductase [Dinghuibacter silviterrae]|nr:TlpA disulfide reductase family protein [Dinghuibacter silviterrae]
MRRIAFAVLALSLSLGASAQLYHGWWQGNLVRPDGQNIVFNFLVRDSAGKTVLYVRNASERLLVDDIRFAGDSVHIRMPFFEAGFRLQLQPDGRLTGQFVRRLAQGELVQPFFAVPRTTERFFLSNGPATVQAQGRYAVRFIGRNGATLDTAVGEFFQDGNHVTGTFLTPSGDDRYLEGVVTGDSLKVSTFDGNHSFVFAAAIDGNHALHGRVYSNIAPSGTWEGVWNPQAGLPDEASHLLNKDSSVLHFRFPDLDSSLVSIGDARFRGKVVVIQIMGSWCPNCMDETAFLAPWYKANRHRGVEIIGLAYERSTDFARSKRGVETFKNRFHATYPMLITGVTVGDPDKAAKTLPQLDAINAFPSTLFLDKHGRVRRITAGFEGPGTGEHYAEFQKDFNDYIDSLLAEKD